MVDVKSLKEDGGFKMIVDGGTPFSLESDNWLKNKFMLRMSIKNSWSIKVL